MVLGVRRCGTPDLRQACGEEWRRRSVREAARQYHSNTTATGEISSVEDTTVRTWMGWSSRHKWVNRANARDAWQARVSDEQIVVNLKACLLAMTTRAHGFLAAQDGGDFLRAAARQLHDTAAHWSARGRQTPPSRCAGRPAPSPLTRTSSTGRKVGEFEL